MKFICKGGSALREFDLEASVILLESIKSMIEDHSAKKAQSCLYFEDVRTWSGTMLSDEIVELYNESQRPDSSDAGSTGVPGDGDEEGGCSARSCSRGPAPPGRGGSCSRGPDSRCPSPQPSVGNRSLSPAARLAQAQQGRRRRLPSVGKGPAGRGASAGGCLSPSPRGRRLPVRSGGAPPRGARPGSTAVVFSGEAFMVSGMMASREMVARPAVKSMLQTASAILGYNVRDTAFFGPDFLLAQPRYAMPITFVLGMVALDELRMAEQEAADRVGCYSGQGTGYITALCAAGVLTFEQGLRLVQARGEIVDEFTSQVRQMVVWVVGLDMQTAECLCAEAAVQAGPGSICEVACVYAHDRCWIAGTEKAVLAFRNMNGRQEGVFMSVMSLTYAPMTSLMLPLREKISDACAGILNSLKPPKHTVWSGSGPVAFRPGCDPNEIRDDLDDYLSSPLLWAPLVEAIRDVDGIYDFWELGHMKGLKGVMRSIDPVLYKRMKNIDL